MCFSASASFTSGVVLTVIGMVWVGIVMATIALGAQFWAIRYGLHWQTIVLNVLCLSQMGHLLAIRSENQSFFRLGMFSNRPLIAAVSLVLILQIVITYVPFLQEIFHTEALTVNEFIAVGILSVLVFFVVEIEKAFRKKKKTNEKDKKKISWE